MVFVKAKILQKNEPPKQSSKLQYRECLLGSRTVVVSASFLAFLIHFACKTLYVIDELLTFLTVTYFKEE